MSGASLATFHLATPLALLLLALPFLAARLLPPANVIGGGLRVPDRVAEALEEASGVFGAAARRYLPWLCWIGLVLALAGPRVHLPIEALPANARDIVLALDLSGSMEREDFQLDGKNARRVDAVKRVASEFIVRRQGDRVGLVVFAESAYVAAPPSFDTGVVRQAVEDATVGFVGRATAIGDGLGLALKRLKDSTSPARIVVLLSDGANNAGKVEPLAASALARELGIRVHTIALGSEIGREATPISLQVDTRALAAIAQTSGGKAFRVASTDDLRRVYEEIDAIEGGEQRAPPAFVPLELWPWPAAAALLAAFLLLQGRSALT